MVCGERFQGWFRFAIKIPGLPCFLVLMVWAAMQHSEVLGCEIRCVITLSGLRHREWGENSVHFT